MKRIYLDVENSTVESIIDELFLKTFYNQGYRAIENHRIKLVQYKNYSKEIDFPILTDNMFVYTDKIDFWPDIEDPMIVYIDVSSDMVIQMWRDELVDQIKKTNIEKDPLPLRIPLFKAGNVGDEINFSVEPRVRDMILDNCESFELPSQIRLKNIYTENI